jgi:hypothetical protein
MTRRIVLELGPQTTAAECGDCPHLVFRRCTAFGIYTEWYRDADSEIRHPRLPECRAAEQPAKEPDDAAG